MGGSGKAAMKQGPQLPGLCPRLALPFSGALGSRSGPVQGLRCPNFLHSVGVQATRGASMLGGSMLGAQSGCLRVLQLLFEEQGICFAQGSRAIHFVVNGAPYSRNPGGAREHRGTKQQQPQTAPPPWRPERGKKKSSTPQTGPAPSEGSLTPSK